MIVTPDYDPTNDINVANQFLILDDCEFNYNSMTNKDPSLEAARKYCALYLGFDSDSTVMNVGISIWYLVTHNSLNVLIGMPMNAHHEKALTNYEWWTFLISNSWWLIACWRHFYKLTNCQFNSIVPVEGGDSDCYCAISLDSPGSSVRISRLLLKLADSET